MTAIDYVKRNSQPKNLNLLKMYFAIQDVDEFVSFPWTELGTFCIT